MPIPSIALLALLGSPKLAWRWEPPRVDVLGLALSPDGREIALVRRVQWPDGAQAEGLPDSFFKVLDARKLKEPRFADPEITVGPVGQPSGPRIDWGWAPAFSPDGKQLAYARQVQPSTGLRTGLAEVLSGNPIVLFDRAAGKGEVVAQPTTAYLASPRFSPDGALLLYEDGDAVNGAWGGAVGLEGIELAGRRAVPLVPPKKVYGYWPLLGDWAFAGPRLFAYVQTAAENGENADLADHYEAALLEPLAHRSVHTWKPVGLGGQRRDWIVKGEGVWFREGRWLDALPSEGKPTGSAPWKKEPPLSIGPEGRWGVETSDAGVRLVRLGASGGTKLTCVPTGAQVSQVVWSADGSRLALLANGETHDTVCVYDLK